MKHTTIKKTREENDAGQGMMQVGQACDEAPSRLTVIGWLAALFLVFLPFWAVFYLLVFSPFSNTVDIINKGHLPPPPSVLKQAL